MSKEKILIVEDQVLVDLFLRDMLKTGGYRVIAPAVSGEEGFRLAEEEKPDLILMDILLGGGMDGIDTAIKIHTRLDIPIVYLTASTDMGNLERAKESEPYGYLIKPVNEYELFSAVETALNRHRLEKRIRESEYQLKERIKELEGLFGLSKLASTDVSMEELLIKFTADIIPPSMQYPDAAFGEIVLDGRSYSGCTNITKKTDNFLSAPIFIMQKERGRLITGYTDRELEFIDIFEQRLIDAYADMISKIIERMEARKQLMEYQKAVESSEDLIATVDRNYVYIFTNRAFLEYHSMEKEQVIGHTVAEVLGEEVFENIAKSNIDKCLQQGESVRFEMQYVYPDPGERLVSVSYYPLRVETGEITGVVAIISDITEKRQLENQLLDISERERVRIGHDLHDGIGQDLTGISYLYRVLADKISRNEFPGEPETKKLMDLIDEAKNHVRMVARGLSPVDMKKNGIMIAVDEMCRNAEKIFDIKCIFDYNDEIFIEDNSIATHIYYIIQESLNNAVKHGCAENINIVLREISSKVEVSVMDDGIGFKEGSDRNSGIGLDLMRYRANIINGTLDFYSREPTGTIVTCSFNNIKR